VELKVRSGDFFVIQGKPRVTGKHCGELKA
jgi:hypothetical protein